MYYYLGDFDRAADRYAMAANLAPNDYQLWGNLGDAYSFTTDKQSAAEISYKRALELGLRQLAINERDVDTISDVAYYNSRLGNDEEALEKDAAARELGPSNMYVYYNSALIHAGLGRKAEALDFLEHAVELGYQVALLAHDPILSVLKEEERYRRLVAGQKR